MSGEGVWHSSGDVMGMGEFWLVDFRLETPLDLSKHFPPCPVHPPWVGMPKR